MTKRHLTKTVSAQRRGRAARHGQQARFVETLESRTLLSVSLDANGWTVVTPSADTRTVYVSNSQGNDANTGLSPDSPVKTLAKGVSLLRNGSPDWLLLKSGDTWNESFGYWNLGGRSASEPMLLSSYGSGNRPRLDTGTQLGIGSLDANADHLAIIGLDFHSGNRPATGGAPIGMRWLAPSKSLLIEDSVFTGYGTGLIIQEYTGPIENVSIRRCVIADNYSTTTHSQGLYAKGIDGLLLEQNVFDHNGWNESVAEAEATIFNHNVYLQSDNTGIVVRGNIFANASSHGLQARSGGDITDNIFINNPIGLSYGFVNGAPTTPGGVQGTVANNIFIGGRDINGATRGWAIEISNTKQGAGTTVRDNIITNDTQKAFPAIQLSYGSGVSNPADAVGINDLTIENNIVHNWQRALSLNAGLVPGGTGLTALNGLTVRNNDFMEPLSGQLITHGPAFNPQIEQWSGNRYYSSADPSAWYSLQSTKTSQNTWKSTIDPTGTYAPAAYPDPDRSVASYNASLGGAATVEAFLAQARKQSKDNWRAAYTAASAIDYIRAGFGLEAINPRPAAPSKLTATPAGSAQINLAWQDNSADETSFVVERKTGAAGTWTTIATLPANTTRFSNTGLSASTQYYYRVRAANNAGLSDLQNEATATTAQAITWNNQVFANQSGNFEAEFDAIPAQTGSDVVIGLSNGAADQYTDMAAMIRFGAVAINARSGATYTAQNPIIYTPGTSYHFRFVVRMDANQYDVYVTPQGQPEVLLGRGFAFRTEQRDVPSLSNFVKVNELGDATLSNFQLTPLTPAAPSNLVATATSSSGITLTWADNSLNEIAFRIERKTGANGVWSELTNIGANITRLTDASVAPGTTYYYRVRAYNRNGNSPYSAEAAATTIAKSLDLPELTDAADSAEPVAAPPAAAFAAPLLSTPIAPSRLLAKPRPGRGIRLNWQDNSTDETAFIIERKVGLKGTWARIAIVDEDVTTYTDKKTSRSATYHYRVRAVNGTGQSVHNPTAKAVMKSN